MSAAKPKPTTYTKTYGEQFNEVLGLKTAEEGAAWLKAEVERLGALPECSHMTPERIASNVRESIGYMTGYYGPGAAEHVREVLGATHPFFGDLSKNRPTPEQALNIGKAIGQAGKARR